MNILFISKGCKSIGIAQKIQGEGHQVKFWNSSPGNNITGYNIIDKVDAWRPHLKWCDLVLVDGVGFSSLLPVFKDFGKPVFSCSPFSDLVELDRNRGWELLKTAGIRTPNTWYFSCPDDYRLDEEAPKEGIIIKPNNTTDPRNTYRCKSRVETDYFLYNLDVDQGFLVEVPPTGIEIITEGWWNGRKWMTPLIHGIKDRWFLNQDYGPYTGGESSVAWSCGEDTLIKATLSKLEPFLKRCDYLGPVRVTSTIEGNEISSSDLMFSLDIDIFAAYLEGLRDGVLDLFFEIASGTKNEVNLSKDYLMSLRITTPPYPSPLKSHLPVGRPIEGLMEENLKHILLTNVYKDDKSIYRCGDGGGLILHITARGTGINSRMGTRSRIYRTASRINISDMQYRNDAGRAVEDEIKALGGWGYL